MWTLEHEIQEASAPYDPPRVEGLDCKVFSSNES